MFLFSLLSGLFSLLISIVLLPLRLLGIPIAVVMMPLRFLLKMFARHTMVFILGFLVLLVVLHFRKNDEKLPQLAPATNAPAPIVEAVRKTEDGDSNFSTDLYALMTQPERQQYSRNFYWAMSTMADMQTHQWAHYNIAGSLRPSDTFTNNSGVRCRHFNEVLKVHHIQQTISGTACELRGGAWCKLKPNATAACNLSGGSTGIMNGLQNSLRNLF